MAVQRRIRGGKTRWVGRYRGADGRERSRTFDARRNAQAWVAEREREVRRGDWADPALGSARVADLAAEYAELATRPATARTRRDLAKNLGPLAGMRVADVRPADIEAWQSTLLRGRPWAGGRPLAPTTVATHRRILAGLMGRAVRDGVIRRSPCDGVPYPADSNRRRVDPATIPAADEVARVVAACEQGVRRQSGVGRVRPYPAVGLMVRVAVATGLRCGEICGLLAGDVDPAAGTIRVTGAAGPRGGRGPAKTPTAYRTVAVDADTLAAVRAWIAEHPRADGRVFATATGAAMGTDMARDALRHRADVVNAPRVRWHALRHLHATELLRAGVPVKTVQARLGHASAAVTLDVYAYAVPADDTGAAAVARGILAGPVRDRPGGLRAL